MSRTSLHSWMGALAILCALAATRPAAGATFVTFNDGNNDNTYALAINAGGVVAGSFCGTDFCHAYVRAADGTITTFDGPDTLTTIASAINRKGAIAGIYGDNAIHGFLRKPDGTFISFDPTGSVNTAVYGINDSGAIAGYWEDASGNYHGFLRAADGTFTTFDPSGSIETVPTAINANGDIAGYYWYTQSNAHGFLRMADGTITSFGDKKTCCTEASGVNRNDAIVGSGDISIGFERMPGGKIRTFKPGLPVTQASGINDKGQITGFYTLSQPPYGYGYVGSPKSGFVSFNVPNGTQTQPYSINDTGVIAGSYYDTNGISNGFLRMP